MDTFLSQTGLLYPTYAFAYDPNDKVPSIYRYSLGIQHELGQGTVLDVSYVGNVARHLIQNYDQNLVPYGAHFLPQNQDPTSPGNALPEDFYRPVPGYNGIETTITSGSSNYNSLQVSINRRYSHAAFGAQPVAARRQIVAQRRGHVEPIIGGPGSEGGRGTVGHR